MAAVPACPAWRDQYREDAGNLHPMGKLLCKTNKGVKAGGTLALSGILTKELDEVRTHFVEQFSTLRPEAKIAIDSRKDGEWGDLLFTLS